MAKTKCTCCIEFHGTLLSFASFQYETSYESNLGRQASGLLEYHTFSVSIEGKNLNSMEIRCIHGHQPNLIAACNLLYKLLYPNVISQGV